jgi:cytochrome c peroxidase
MKAYFYPVLLTFLLSITFIDCKHRADKSPIEASKILFAKDLDSLDNLINNTLLPLAKHTNNQDSIQNVFKLCRLQYKKIEHFTEYFFPTTSRLVNGPPLPEYELEENKEFEPAGLQVIEEHIFPFDTANRQDLIREIVKVQPEIRRFHELWEVTEYTESHIFDAVRLQLFRNISLGISGFDTPICKTALPEMISSMTALREYILLFENNSNTKIGSLFKKAIAYTNLNNDFDVFDRLFFITEFANPLSQQLLTFQKELGFDTFDELRALKSDAATLFEKNIFNADFYTGNTELFGTPDKVVLGKMLFYDTKLSKNQQRSCSSCHQADRAFTDGLVKSTKLGGGSIERNTPTILYAALQQRQFHDQRSMSLEAQTQDVIQNREEMHGSLPEACNILQKDSTYLALFKKAFPLLKKIEPKHLMNALASYERSLLPFNSRFDRYMRGEKTLLSESEKKGFNLFMGKAKCGICHFMPLFNGTVPPNFTKSESEVIGVFTAPRSKKIDPDKGKGRYYPTLPDLKYAFKTPTIRNIALTAPYMHNGAYKTIESIIDFYDHGGALGLGVDLPNQTLPSEKLHLTRQDKRDLEAFMGSLTDLPVYKTPLVAHIKEH